MLKRVLVVEDDEAIARLLSANLVREGFQVARAGTATEARSQLEGEAIRLWKDVFGEFFPAS